MHTRYWMWLLLRVAGTHLLTIGSMIIILKNLKLTKNDQVLPVFDHFRHFGSTRTSISWKYEIFRLLLMFANSRRFCGYSVNIIRQIIRLVLWVIGYPHSRNTRQEFSRISLFWKLPMVDQQTLFAKNFY